MYFKQILVTVSILACLSSSTFAARTTTVKPTIPGKTTKPTASKNTTSKDGISLRLDQTSPNATVKGSNKGKIITTRLGSNGNPEEQCQCTLFYLCDQSNVVDFQPGSGNECPDSSNVCCRIPIETLTTDEPPLPPIVNPDSSPVIPNLSSSTDSSQSNCVCVPFYQCMGYDPLVQTAGAGLIDPRFPCTTPDICCPTEMVTSAGNGGNSPVTPPVVDRNPSPPYVDPTPTPPYVPPVVPVNPNECGIRRPSVDNRISAPEHLAQTSFGEFPWMALILTTEIAPNGSQVENVFVCGASLITPSIVMTAAHCVAQMDMSLLRVRVGEYNTHQGSSEPLPHQDRPVQSIQVHTSYNNKVLFNDLALMRVEPEFILNSHITPICAGFVNSAYAEPNAYDPSRCLATGWGRNAFREGNYQTTLKRVDLTLIQREECQSRLRQTRLGQYFILDPSFICAGGQPGFDTCQGDGGGPLVCATINDPNRYIQVGVISWGIGCATDVPGVYASLESNQDWLTLAFNTLSVFRRAPS